MFSRYVAHSGSYPLVVLMCALAGASLSLVGCSAGSASEVPAAARPEAVAVEVIFAPERVELVQSLPKLRLSEQEPEAPGETDLRWELVDASGAFVADGHAPDTRMLRYETYGEASMVDPRASSGTLVAEIPNIDGVLRVFEADGQQIGALALEAIDAQPPANDEWIPGKADVDFDRDVLGEPVLHVGTGERKRAFNLLILPEGYQEAEMAQFHQDVALTLDSFKEAPVFAENIDSFNIWSQDVKSTDSGISEPGIAAKRTAFDVAYGDGERIPRRCMMPSASWTRTSVANMRRFGRAVKADIIILMVNTLEYGGCARMAEKFLSVASPRGGHDTGRVLAHELGHALFGLADEYTGTYTSCGKGPNLARNLNDLPWRDLIVEGTPIPTLDDGHAEGRIGAFEGGGYCEQGIYRPQYTCLMRATAMPPCAVCAREMRRALRARTGRAAQ